MEFPEIWAVFVVFFVV